MGMVGGIHPNGARYVVQHLVGLSMRGSCYMGAGGPVETGACKLSSALESGDQAARVQVDQFNWWIIQIGGLSCSLKDPCNGGPRYMAFSLMFVMNQYGGPPWVDQ